METPNSLLRRRRILLGTRHQHVKHLKYYAQGWEKSTCHKIAGLPNFEVLRDHIRADLSFWPFL